MSTEKIHCLIYRYKRVRERMCAVKTNGSQFIPLDEIEYKASPEFFLNSKFSEFLENTSNFFDICIINQNDEQGESFMNIFQTYYNCLDDSATIWTEEKIRAALSSLNLKNTLKVGNIIVDGKDGRYVIASIFGDRKMNECICENNEVEFEVHSDETRSTSEELDTFPEIKIQSKYKTQCKEKPKKSNLSLAMDEIVSETYKT